MTTDPEPSGKTTREISVQGTLMRDNNRDLASFSSFLLSDEPFREPTSIGEFLPNGRERYLAWAERTQQEIKYLPTVTKNINPETVDLCDSENDTESFENPFKPKTAGKNNDAVDTERELMINRLLRTTELFPSKYIVESDEVTHSDVKPQIEPEKKKNSRKSVLFPTIQSKTKEDKDQTLSLLVPSNASGIVSVMGRRIHADKLVQGNASIYSMLRAWIRDDPENTPCSPPTDRANVRRKTLSDYAFQPNKDKKSTDKPTTEKSSRSVDLLGWLSMDPGIRPYTPCYPTMEEMRDLHKKRERKRDARRLRKRRLAAAKESLRRKGINV
eukprot:CAMPEP_0116151706 /NCGR_PEP_ID=MMETSP0329-20121206/20245_1 /TAXON_ID=697910 /ORGANISM="Pseudo-nitzschia arenysensis, Strain B593" /LENGTH=328 /DNA_ID=CAMNT_0003648347 /DNA_START=34 /DNA_END=1021 /DNA_ORIENTATION=-